MTTSTAADPLGAAVRNCQIIVHLLVGDPILLAGVAILICGMISLFPTRARATRWIERQQESLRDDEQSARVSP